MPEQIADAFLLVDPVDGTKEFVQRKGDFTVNIALIVGGAPVAGCVFAPARREMYFGGGEARLIEAFEPGARLTEGRVIARRATIRPTALSRSPRPRTSTSETKKFLARHRIASQTGIGSSLKFCWVAAGRADVYPRWGPTMEWDTAAGHAVLQAAGGRMLKPDGSPFLYGKGATRVSRTARSSPGAARRCSAALAFPRLLVQETRSTSLESLP